MDVRASALSPIHEHVQKCAWTVRIIGEMCGWSKVVCKKLAEEAGQDVEFRGTLLAQALGAEAEAESASSLQKNHRNSVHRDMKE